ncbi:MAG: hypothetical protein KH102_07600, partial [Ligilactobacillus ruminis]|nr:hypothetical protein [Ligilactobacillus ruminis]
ASVRPEPGSNSQFIVCDSKFTSELTSQILLLLFETRSPAHLLIETLFSFQRSTFITRSRKRLYYFIKTIC